MLALANNHLDALRTPMLQQLLRGVCTRLRIHLARRASSCSAPSPGGCTNAPFALRLPRRPCTGLPLPLLLTTGRTLCALKCLSPHAPGFRYGKSLTFAVPSHPAALSRVQALNRFRRISAQLDRGRPRMPPRIHMAKLKDPFMLPPSSTRRTPASIWMSMCGLSLP